MENITQTSLAGIEVAGKITVEHKNNNQLFVRYKDKVKMVLDGNKVKVVRKGDSVEIYLNLVGMYLGSVWFA